VIVEVKAGRHLRSYRDARARLKVCAGFFPYFTYILADREKGWAVELIGR
jgi:hypothetical protein